MTDGLRKWAVKPRIFDVMWARFPYHGEGGRPANDKHPVLVCQVAEDGEGDCWVGCYYGTSNIKLDERDELDLVIMSFESIQKMALSKHTRFDLDRCMWLPFDDQYFIENPKSPGSPIFAKAPERVIAKLKAKLRYRIAIGLPAYPVDPDIPTYPPHVPEGMEGPDRG